MNKKMQEQIDELTEKAVEHFRYSVRATISEAVGIGIKLAQEVYNEKESEEL